MLQIKSFIKILLLSLVAVLPVWQVSAIAAESKQPSTTQQISSVNINTANAEQLAGGLKGVGMTRAQSIVEYRATNGAFTSPEQLLSVKGVGEKVLEKNRDRIVLK
ncbi:MAG: helix-hairpin-helix domain-containing protein [Porticoccus sp.]|nr:helix-hairpin-helix domain-containing protein [Porticoccus sp.]